MLELMGVAEVAEFLGVTRQRVDQLVADPSFPEPEARLAAGRIWLRDQIEQWAAATGRVRNRDVEK